MLQKIIQMIHKSEKPQTELQKLIYDMFCDKIYQTVYFVTKDPHTTNDILQETFIKAFEKLDTIKEPDKIGAWLKVIAIRMSINHYRKFNKVQHIELDETYVQDHTGSVQALSVENNVELSILKEQIIQKIDNLSYIHREVLAMKYIAELNDAEIAEALELNIGTVKSRIHRAKQKLFIDMQNDPEFIGGEMIEV